MNISTLLYGRGLVRESPRLASKSVVSDINRILVEESIDIRIFEHSPLKDAHFREVHVASPRIQSFRESYGLSCPEILPLLRIINGSCTVDDLDFSVSDNNQTIKLLKNRIDKIAKEKAASLLMEISNNCNSLKVDFSQKAPTLLDYVINNGSRITVENRFTSPRLGFKEDLPLLLLDNDHADRVGVKGFKGIYSAKRDRFIISNGTFYIIGQGDNFNIKTVTVSILQPRLSLAGIIQDTLGEPLLMLERCYGEMAKNIGFHLKETCRAQLLTVSNKLI